MCCAVLCDVLYGMCFGCILGVHDELERSMLSKLKAECGYQFTSKLEGMFTDMRLSRGVNDDYQEHLRTRQPSQEPSNRGRAIEFEVTVLTAGFWPSVTKTDIRLPELAERECVEQFTSYYLSSNACRKLSWQYHLGAFWRHKIEILPVCMSLRVYLCLRVCVSILE